MYFDSGTRDHCLAFIRFLSIYLLNAILWLLSNQRRTEMMVQPKIERQRQQERNVCNFFLVFYFARCSLQNSIYKLI